MTLCWCLIILNIMPWNKRNYPRGAILHGHLLTPLFLHLLVIYVLLLTSVVFPFLLCCFCCAFWLPSLNTMTSSWRFYLLMKLLFSSRVDWSLRTTRWTLWFFSSIHLFSLLWISQKFLPPCTLPFNNRTIIVNLMASVLFFGNLTPI